MKTTLMRGCVTALAFLSAFVRSDAQRPWQRIEMVTTAQLQANFREPPPEYSATVTWGWDSMNEGAIAKDLDVLYSRGFRAVTIEAGYRMSAEYLSDGWFALIERTVAEAKKRNMRVWIIDEGKYPSGFANGKFSRERPELRMQALLVSERIRALGGEVVRRTFSPDAISAVAVNMRDSSSVNISIRSGVLDWAAPPGDWEVLVASHGFRTSPTRAVSNATGGKDTVNSLFDYLNPAGTKQFIDFTHAQYLKRLEADFGQTIMGFRGDEPDYGNTPWTPAIVDEFQKAKGYDVRPYLASFFVRTPNDETKRVKADYWDVWSRMFSANFFDPQATWLESHGIEHTTHLNHEDKALQMARSEGDYFRDMRHVQIPGVDVIWNQIWPDSAPADFPKIASSAAHLFGRPRALTESFAAFKPAPAVDEAKWVIDHQLTRGINLFEFMFYMSSARGTVSSGGYMGDPRFPALNAYVHRLSYVLSRGRPAAEIALFYPTSSFWMGDASADSSSRRIARQLLEHQRDFDWVDETSLSSLLAIRDGQLVNLSGQGYTTVIVPAVIVLSADALAKLCAFTRAGGHVVFLGKTPTMVPAQSFLRAGGAPDLGWATVESSGAFTPAVMSALPTADLTLDVASPDLRYEHRKLADGELYFIFNEGKTAYTGVASLRGVGKTESWDAMTGVASPIAVATNSRGMNRVPLRLLPGETRLIVLR